MDAGCGYADSQHLVICLDAAGRMAEADQLRLLAFSRDPIRITAGSPLGSAAAREVLSAHKGPSENIETVFSTAGCSGGCERRITVELQ